MDTTAARTPARRRSSQARRRQVFVQGAMVGFVLLAWLLLFRWFVPHGDDFRHLGIGNRPGGEFTASQWWDALVVDYTLRNGRGADAAVRLLLGPLEAGYRLLAPALLTLLSVVSARWVLTDRLADRAPAAWFLTGLATPPVLFLLQPAESGDALFWGSGFTNYALPVLCALGAALLVRRALDLEPGPWLVPAAVVVLLGHLLHEQASAATLVMVAVVLLASSYRSVAALVLGGVSVVGFLVNLLAPGIWRRLEEPQGPGVPLLEGAARAVDALTRTGRPFLWLLVLSVTLVTAAVLRSRGAARSRLLGLTAVTWLGFVSLQVLSSAAGSAGNHLACGSGPRPGVSVLAVAVLASAVALGLGMFLWLLALVPFVGVGAPALWAGSLAGLAIPMVTSRCHGRALFVSLVILAVVSVMTVRAAVDVHHPRPVARRVPTFLAAASVVVVVAWTVVAAGGVRANAAAVHELEADLGEARAGDTVLLPELPARDFGYTYAFRLPRYGCEIALYYDVPEGVVLRAPDGETYEVERPCVTGWDAWLVDRGLSRAG